MSRTNLRKRVAALNDAINPARSLTAKLAKLTKEQQGEYHRWRDRYDRYYAAVAARSANAYEQMLEGDIGPPLHKIVADALFGPTPLITVDMTDVEIQEIYHKLCKGV